MKDPKVTIIVPCYNHEKYIFHCITSIMEQTYENIDLIVINDGSIDNSVKILKELENSYKFKFFDQTNQGLIQTLNKALSENNLGKYICLFASDDYIPKDRIELQVRALEENEDSYLCFGNYTEVDENNKIIEKIKIRPPEENYFSELLLSNYIPAPTVMFRASVLEEVGLYDQNFKIEDWYMWLKILSRHPRAIYLNSNLAYYRLHNTNFHSNVELITKESFKIIDQYKEDKNYDLAKSIIISKHIIKSFLESRRKGLEQLKELFSLKLCKNLVYCLVKGIGPFRKIKLKYFYW